MRIAYDVTGTGPMLLLLHGLEGSRGEWHDLGYVKQLGPSFTVVAMDLRGHGDSAAPTDSAAYDIDMLLSDVLAVADAVDAHCFSLWGFSFGGSIALHLAARSDRVERGVIAGSFFGRVYPPERVEPISAEWEVIARAQAEGALDQLGLPPEEVTYLAGTQAAALSACGRALSTWPVVEPRQVRCPLFLLAGAADERVAAPLEARRAEIEAADMQVQILAGLDHAQTLQAIDVVLPPARAFLLADRG